MKSYFINSYRFLFRAVVFWLNLARAVNGRIRTFNRKRQRYIPIRIGTITVMFANGPLKDDRGIGRVTRELLKQLTAIAETHKYDQQHATSGTNPSCRTVYFFPSIHWCPDLLPRPSVVAIHDVIPLIFSESFTAPSLEWKRRLKPSIYEGFGLPPLEAILLGTPPVCSRRPAMTEVLDGLAFFADPDDPAEWARCLRQVMENPPSTEERREKAEKAAELYSWEAAARKLLDCCFETSIML